MITAILSMAVVWCLFFGRIPLTALIPICVVLGAALVFLSRHKHTQFLKIDVLAQVSRLNRVNPTLKFWSVLALMGICISSGNPAVGVLMTVLMLSFSVFVGGLRLHEYVHLLALPVSFLMLSGLALLIEATAQPTGVINIPLFNFWLSISEQAQIRTALVMSNALGAVSCLYLLSLTTPMSEIIGVLRRVRCPDVIIDLMYLIYRYTFILLDMHHTMRNAAKSRLGFIDYRTSVRTTGNLYSNLLSCSYRQAYRNFDAMESRCFDKSIRFLENREKITVTHAAVSLFVIVPMLMLTIFLR